MSAVAAAHGIKLTGREVALLCQKVEVSHSCVGTRICLTPCDSPATQGFIVVGLKCGTRQAESKRCLLVDTM